MSYPKQVKRHESSLDIVWSDGSKTEIPSIKLRSHCPCASCREKRGEGEHSRPIRKQVKSSLLRVIEHTAEESHLIKSIDAVGNYAISITWGDGHSTGIYPFELLKTLGGTN